ncbi:MAG: hypothetical protein QOD99_2837 [Chthoniobacter sp.]|jgi:hypothetical protein|nr:hypothetical protein [Chthoniobacter sp.]
MTHPAWSFIFSVGFAAIAVLFALIAVWSLRRYLGIKREQAYLLSIATALAAAGTGIYRYYLLNEANRDAHAMSNDAIVTSSILTGLLALFAIPLTAKFYCAWIGDHATEQEKKPGMEGVRAWLCPANLTLAALVSVCAWTTLGYSLFGTLSLILLALVIHPLATMLAQVPPSAVAPLPETLSTERDKVLAMLDAGKITAEECAELLNALSVTVTATRSARAPLSPQQRIVTLGAALVLVGFFLPWFSINPGRELGRMTGQMQGMMNQFSSQMPGAPSNPAFPPGMSGSFQISTPSVNIAGGDVEHGLGWFILILSLGVAALPFARTQLDEKSQRTATFIALAVGSVLHNLRFLNVGLVLTIAGYAVQWIGVARPLALADAASEVGHESA